MSFRKVPNPRSRQGIALMMTLAVAFFLLVLLGAFVIVHRSSNSLTVSGQKRQRAYNACLSGLHILWGELELDPTLGAGPFTDGREDFFPEDDPKVKLSYHGLEPAEGEIPDINANYVEGEMLDTRDTFELRYINNLGNRTAAEETQMGTVAPRCAKIQIVGSSGGVNVTLETVLRKKPYVDYSMLSSENMSVNLDTVSNADALVIGSDDPYINQIRSNEEILGPSAVDGDLRFAGPPRGGVAKAKDDIRLGNRSILSDPDFLTDSEEQAEGSFQAGTPQVDVPGLARDDLKLPSTATNVNGNIKLRRVIDHQSIQDPLDSSRYILRKTQYNAVQYDDQVWVGTAGWEHPPAYSNAPGPTGFQAAEGDPLPSPPHEGEDYPVLHRDGEAKVQVDLTTGDIAFSPGMRFEVPGDFDVRGERGTLTPKVLLGYDIVEGGEPVSPTSQYSADHIAENPDEFSTAIVSSNGINIEGPVDGFGTIFAEGAVTLQAKPTVAADPVLPLALHGHSVNFKVAAERPSDKRHRRSLDTDWEVFQKAIDTSPDDDRYGFGQYKDWHEDNSPGEIEGQHRVIGDDPDDAGNPAFLRYKGTGLTGDQAWSSLREDMGLGPDEEPDFDAPPFDSEWGGGNMELTLEQYVGLREYLRKPDHSARNNWILRSDTMTGPGFDSITSQIRIQIERYASWADHMNKSMDSFMMQDGFRVADVFFIGLVHAGRGGFHAEASGYTLFFEGALVSQGEINISETPDARFVYNRDYLDDVVKHTFEDPVPLDQVYFKVH